MAAPFLAIEDWEGVEEAVGRPLQEPERAAIIDLATIYAIGQLSLAARPSIRDVTLALRSIEKAAIQLRDALSAPLAAAALQAIVERRIWIERADDETDNDENPLDDPAAIAASLAREADLAALHLASPEYGFSTRPNEPWISYCQDMAAVFKQITGERATSAKFGERKRTQSRFVRFLMAVHTQLMPATGGIFSPFNTRASIEAFADAVSDALSKLPKASTLAVGAKVRRQRRV